MALSVNITRPTLHSLQVATILVATVIFSLSLGYADEEKTDLDKEVKVERTPIEDVEADFDHELWEKMQQVLAEINKDVATGEITEEQARIKANAKANEFTRILFIDQHIHRYKERMKLNVYLRKEWSRLKSNVNADEISIEEARKILYEATVLAMNKSHLEYMDEIDSRIDKAGSEEKPTPKDEKNKVDSIKKESSPEKYYIKRPTVEILSKMTLDDNLTSVTVDLTKLIGSIEEPDTAQSYTDNILQMIDTLLYAKEGRIKVIQEGNCFKYDAKLKQLTITGTPERVQSIQDYVQSLPHMLYRRIRPNYHDGPPTVFVPE